MYCIPVVEVRARHTNSMRGQWEAYKPVEAAATAAALTAMTTTPRRGGSEGLGMEAKGRRATPGKMQGREFVPCRVTNENGGNEY